MKRLRVKDFSCIQDGDVEFDRLTVFIGPQASGKSVLCKLAYFLLDTNDAQIKALAKKSSFEKFTEILKKEFVEWFPTTAWGPGKFRISFSAGDYEVTLDRKAYNKVVSDDFRIKFCAAFKAQYEGLLKELTEPSEKRAKELSRYAFSYQYEVARAVRDSMARLMGKDAVAHQTFIPAGRSFFTSIGKAIAAFEQGRVLDPLILRFGQIYTAYRSDRVYLGDERKESSQARANLGTLLGQILGGQMKTDGDDRQFLSTSDGRDIPMSALSSGQQELLPLATVLPYLSVQANTLCYIEEPEAHLFPSSQSALIEALASIVNRANGSDLVVTTHSPYVLTKINNLIKAGALGRRSMTDSLRKSVDQIVSRRYWLSGRTVRAYAIIEGVVVNIIDKESLIDAAYVDEVSGDLAREFAELLELEAATDAD